jgi:plasmid stability protein
MAGRSMTITIPDALYDRIERRAASKGRSVETEAANLLSGTFTEEQRSQELEAELAGLPLLDDEQLWRAARSRLTDSQVRRLRSLNYKDQSEGLTDAEERARGRLIHLYERAMLIRAHAAVLLKGRGHDIDVLLETK